MLEFLRSSRPVASEDATVAGTLRARRSGFGGPWDDAGFSRSGAACQAGEPRAFAAAVRRTAAVRQAGAGGQPDAIALLRRRPLTVTSAPILSRLRRMGPQVAWSHPPSGRPVRGTPHTRT